MLGEYRIGASQRRIRLVVLLPYEFLSQIALSDQRNNGAQTPLPLRSCRLLRREKIFPAGLTGASGSGIIQLSPVRRYADLAQLVEQLIRNEQVVGSSPIISSI